MLFYSKLFTIVSLSMIFAGLWNFVSYRKHLLNSLLSLEFIMLGIFSVMVMSFSAVGNEMFFTLFFLTFAACEGALGLSLLVSIVRSHGNDYFSGFKTLEC